MGGGTWGGCGAAGGYPSFVRLVRFIARRFEPVRACSEGYPYPLKIIN